MGVGADLNVVNLLLNITAAVGLLLTGYYTFRISKKRGVDAAQERLTQVYQQELDAVRIRADRLHSENEAKDETIKVLAARPDQTQLVDQITRFHGQLILQLKEINASGEERYSAGMEKLFDRFAEQGKVLAQIASTLAKIERRLDAPRQKGESA